MPSRLNLKAPKSLVSKGMKYEILFSYKQDSSKYIYKALRKEEHTGIQQEVLLKIFLDEKKAYQKEFESLSQVCSPYCVRLFGFENFMGKQALVLESIKGVSLFELLKSFSLNEQEIHHILLSIYKGLKDLHQQGLCHGDLSLNNVLIDEKACIKLIDFGKANYDKDLQGTPPFVAPELFQGVRSNFLSDLFSLGIIELVLKNPNLLSSLSQMKEEDFYNDSPLLCLDPKKREFPYSKKDRIEKNSLSYKVKDLLLVSESKHCQTLNPIQGKVPKSLFLLKFLVLVFLSSFFGIASSQTSFFPKAILKIHTHQWFTVRIGSFESYTPLSLPLKSGQYLIQWTHPKGKGKTKVFISKGETLFLNDKSFFIKENSSE